MQENHYWTTYMSSQWQAAQPVIVASNLLAGI
jgi:hypothetical protein